jgi:periplasmic protein TonB
MSAYAPQQDSTFLSRRAIVLVVIILLHVLLAYGLATGLARRAMEIIAPPIQTTIVEEVQQHDLPPPPPPPEFERPPVEVPPPDISIDIPAEPTQSTAITDVTNQHVAAAPPPRPSNRTNPKPGKNFPNTADYYPAASMRLGEEGSTVVRACVGPNGKLAEDPTVAKTSGSARLDEGAVKLAKAGHYEPGTEDGKPVTACINFSIKFQLKN